jgi:hypothetical protein
MEREAISKRLRFEIFKRDGFTCVYCGAPPTGGVMHLDHVVPVVEGGDSTAENLVTACSSCNLGKSSVPLERKVLAPFDPTSAEEHAEQLRGWVAAQKMVSEAKKAVEQELVNCWCEAMGTQKCDREVPLRLAKLTTEWPMPRIIEALEIVGSKHGLYRDTNRLKYMYGIFRRWREQAEIDEARAWVAAHPEAVKNGGL